MEGILKSTLSGGEPIPRLRLGTCEDTENVSPIFLIPEDFSEFHSSTQPNPYLLFFFFFFLAFVGPALSHNGVSIMVDYYHMALGD